MDMTHTCVSRCETDYVRLYLDVGAATPGVNELTDWTVELCGNGTAGGGSVDEFFSSSSNVVLELHTAHHSRRRQQQHERRRRPVVQFAGFRGTFRFLQKGQTPTHTHTHTHTRTHARTHHATNTLQTS